LTFTKSGMNIMPSGYPTFTLFNAPSRMVMEILSGDRCSINMQLLLRSLSCIRQIATWWQCEICIWLFDNGI